MNPDGWTSPIAKFLKPEEVKAIEPGWKRRRATSSSSSPTRPGSSTTPWANLRVYLARKLNLIEPGQFAFTWVTEFPLMEYSETEKRFVSTHHPFTSPVLEDLPLLETDPGKVRARAYDLVLNGSEIGGGSIRIHRQDVQAQIFRPWGSARKRPRRSSASSWTPSNSARPPTAASPSASTG